MKVISDTYLYHNIFETYNKKIFDYIMTSDRVDKNSDGFSDIIYAVKKQANTVLLKVLLSDKVVLMTNQDGGLSRAFKVIYVKDVKDTKKDMKKVFIDCSGIIKYNNGTYSCDKIGILISYLTAAMTYILYYNNPRSITSNFVIVKSGAEAFVDLFLYVLGYLKIPVTFADNKERMAFVLAEYFQYSIVGITSDDSIYNLAKKISGITEKRTCDYLHATFSSTLGDGKADINTFLIKFAKVFLDQDEQPPINSPKNRTRLTVDAFAQRWMYAFGQNTFLGLECFVPFSQILTDCYNGAFINQQNTIEKVASSKTVVTFSNELLKIGSENA